MRIRRRMKGCTAVLSSIRFLLKVNGQTFKVATVALSKSDASLYIAPAIPSGWVVHAGTTKMPNADGPSSTWDYSQQLTGSRHLKLSLHDSGRTHAVVDDEETNPLFGPPMTGSEGGHVATIAVFSPSGLELTRPRTGSSSSTDLVLTCPTPDRWTSTHISLHICPTKESATKMHRVVETVGFGGQPTWLGIWVRGGTDEPPEKAGPGIICIGGWGAPAPQTATTAVYAASRPPLT